MTATAKGPKISEAAFQAQVLHLAALKGWRTAHFRTAQDGRGNYRTPVAGDGKGFPDLVLVRLGPGAAETRDASLAEHRGFEAALADLRATSVGAPRLIFAELKADGEYPEPAQREWLADLALLPGAEVYVWRPSDFDTIVEVLS